MNCWHCQTELIWGGDHDIEEENEDYTMVTNLSCPKCHSHVDVYYPSKKLIKEYKKDFLEEVEKEKQELNDSYQESVRQANERKET